VNWHQGFFSEFPCFVAGKIHSQTNQSESPSGMQCEERFWWEHSIKPSPQQNGAAVRLFENPQPTNFSVIANLHFEIHIFSDS